MHEQISEEQVAVIDKQTVQVEDFACSGYVLDIGGGGEGIIGVLKGEKVIAIDMRKEELEEAPEGPLKIVMDARALQFLDNSFEVVTSFFTLMYMSGSDRGKVFEEVYRVLRPHGKFFIWDAVIPPQEDDRKEWFMVPAVISVGNKEIETGYGVRWKGREHDVTSCIDLAERNGFEVVEKEEHDQVFFLQLKKS